MSPPNGNASRRTVARKTIDLYRSCMSLSEEARSLHVKNEGMKRLGLNAQVLAAQTGEQGSALEVIVAEIGRLSGSIRESLASLGEVSNALSRSSIGILHLSNLHWSYAEGWTSGIEESSRDRYSRVLEDVGARQVELLEDLDLRLGTVSGLVGDLGRTARQIPPVTTMIQIVVTEVGIRSVELLGTVDDLKSFHIYLDDKIGSMGQIWKACVRRIGELKQEER